jgi:hypothetical protein
LASDYLGEIRDAPFVIDCPFRETAKISQPAF